jgi:hypothetical protein
MGNFHQMNKENEQPMQSNMALTMNDGSAFNEPTMAMQLGDQHPMSFMPQ